MGYRELGFYGLFRQLSWAAERLNAAYYLSARNELSTLSLIDGDQIKLAKGLNPGTIAVQNLVSRASTWAEFSEQVTGGDFAHTYRSLFGDPFAYQVNPVIPENLTQPVFRLPWEYEHTWWFTGGPHNGWAKGSAWAAVDFAPTSARKTCRISAEWALAVAPGQVVQAENGRVVVDMDGDGFQGTGWSLLYMHIAAKDRVAIGTQLKTGDRIGHPSCEGGYSTGTHLHFARLYNGQWIPAADERVPMNLAGWIIKSNDIHYDGIAIYNRERRESDGGWDEAKSGIRAIPGLLVGAFIGDALQATNSASAIPLSSPDTKP
jgi:murein DD-endopeptidase MepM/ murein hydrolase activator NlpD